jgi:hypothetical protein
MRSLWVVVVMGCAARTTPTQSAGFAVSYPDAQRVTVKQGARFYAKPEARCTYEDTGREARWTISGARLASGELPPGLTLEDGVIGGVPKQAGNFHAKIEFATVTCAGKTLEGQTVDVDISVTSSGG